MLCPRDNASAGRGALPASLGGWAVASGVCKARCCVVGLWFHLSVLLSKKHQVKNCILCNSSPISAAYSRSHPQIWNKNVRSEAASTLTSADFISPLGTGVPILHQHGLTPPGHNKDVANHRYISIFLPSILISLYSKKKKKEKSGAVHERVFVPALVRQADRGGIVCRLWLAWQPEKVGICAAHTESASGRGQGSRNS